MGVMDGTPRSRMTLALAVAAIVAAVALLVGGAVLAPSGETEAPVETPVVEDDEGASAPVVATTRTTAGPRGA